VKIRDVFWSIVGFIRFGFVKCPYCGIRCTYLYRPGVDIYEGIPSKEWAYFCCDCPTVLFSDDKFQIHKKGS